MTWHVRGDLSQPHVLIHKLLHQVDCTDIAEQALPRKVTEFQRKKRLQSCAATICVATAILFQALMVMIAKITCASFCFPRINSALL